MDNSVVVVFSGGQDSTICLHWALQRFQEVHTVTFDYAQRHLIEVDCAAKISGMARVASHELIILPEAILSSTSPLVDAFQQVKHYKDVDSLPGGLEDTFVPCRNLLFLTLAANRAVALDCRTLITGVCEEDSGGYPDCRQTFIDSMATTIERALGCRFSIITPLMKHSKQASVMLATSLSGCMEALAYSHTCYEGTYPPCQKCHACLLREKGFKAAGIADPLLVRAGIISNDKD